MENYSPYSGFLLVSENSRESAYDQHVPGTPHFVSIITSHSQYSEPQLVPSPGSETGSLSCPGTPSTAPATPVYLDHQFSAYLSSIPQIVNSRLRTLQHPPESPLQVPSFDLGSPVIESTPRMSGYLDQVVLPTSPSVNNIVAATTPQDNIAAQENLAQSPPVSHPANLVAAAAVGDGLGDDREDHRVDVEDKFRTPDRKFRGFRRIRAPLSAPSSGRFDFGCYSPIIASKRNIGQARTPNSVQRNLFTKQDVNTPPVKSGPCLQQSDSEDDDEEDASIFTSPIIRKSKFLSKKTSSKHSFVEENDLNAIAGPSGDSVGQNSASENFGEIDCLSSSECEPSTSRGHPVSSTSRSDVCEGCRNSRSRCKDCSNKTKSSSSCANFRPRRSLINLS